MKAGWEEKKLGEVCEYFNGVAHEHCIDENGKYKLINSKFISSDGLNFKSSNLGLFLLKRGDITMCLSDVPNGKTLAKCFLVEKDETYTLNQRICVVRSTRMLEKFLYYQLNRNQHLLNFDNGENQTNLRLNQVLECPLYLPSISEQLRIVTILDQAFEGIAKARANAEQNLQNARALFESHLQSVFSQRGDGFEAKIFDEVLEIKNGKDQKPVEKAGGKYPIYGSAGNVMGWTDSYICDEQTTIIGRKGTINRPIFIETKFWNVDTAFGLAAKPNLNAKFLYFFCLSYDFSLHNRGTTIPSLVKTDLLNIKISVPSLSVQELLVNKFTALHNETKRLEALYQRKITLLDELKKSLLQQAFAGEL